MIDDLKQKRLEKILLEIKSLEKSIQPEDSFLETRKQCGELVINGNVEGLIYLASEILELAKLNLSGKHVHYDDASALDHCDQPFLIALKSPEWNSEQVK